LVLQTRALSHTPDETMLKRLRILERKMGLVLTLVRLHVSPAY
jgi:DASH complex subunit DAD3